MSIEEDQLEKDTSPVLYTFTSYQEIREFVSEQEKFACEGDKVILLDISKAVSMITPMDTKRKNKISFIRLLRALTGISLREAKLESKPYYKPNPPIMLGTTEILHSSDNDQDT